MNLYQCKSCIALKYITKSICVNANYVKPYKFKNKTNCVYAKGYIILYSIL